MDVRVLVNDVVDGMDSALTESNSLAASPSVIYPTSASLS